MTPTKTSVELAETSSSSRSVSANLSAERAPADVASLLGIRPGTPLLRIERKAYTFGDVPVELRITWVNTAECKFHVDQGSTI